MSENPSPKVFTKGSLWVRCLFEVIEEARATGALVVHFADVDQRVIAKSHESTCWTQLLPKPGGGEGLWWFYGWLTKAEAKEPYLQPYLTLLYAEDRCVRDKTKLTFVFEPFGDPIPDFDPIGWFARPVLPTSYPSVTGWTSYRPGHLQRER